MTVMVPMSGDAIDGPQLTVIIPCFNCGHFIAESITTLSTSLSDAGIVYEILVVDDGSTDDTAQRLASVQDPHVKVFRLQRNCGKGLPSRKVLSTHVLSISSLLMTMYPMERRPCFDVIRYFAAVPRW